MRGGAGEDRNLDVERFAFAEVRHERLDLIADEFLPNEQGISDALDDGALRGEQATDARAAVVEDRVHLAAAIGVADDRTDGVPVEQAAAGGSDRHQAPTHPVEAHVDGGDARGVHDTLGCLKA